MKIDATALAWVGAAVATPTVLRMVHPAGYVTAGQRAALATFSNTNGLTLAPVVSDAVDHAIDLTSAQIVADTVLAAAHAGAFVDVPNVQHEAYNPFTDFSWFAGTLGGIAGDYLGSLREAQWQALGDTDDGKLSALGRAVARTMRARGGSDVGELGAACNQLASAMDDVGLLAQAPPDVTPLSWLYDHTIGKLLPSTTTLVMVGAAALGALYLAHKEGLL